MPGGTQPPPARGVFLPLFVHAPHEVVEFDLLLRRQDRPDVGAGLAAYLLSGRIKRRIKGLPLRAGVVDRRANAASAGPRSVEAAA